MGEGKGVAWVIYSGVIYMGVGEGSHRIAAVAWWQPSDPPSPSDLQ